jgi:hypothetical protein
MDVVLGAEIALLLQQTNFLQLKLGKERVQIKIKEVIYSSAVLMLSPSAVAFCPVRSRIPL